MLCICQVYRKVQSLTIILKHNAITMFYVHAPYSINNRKARAYISIESCMGMKQLPVQAYTHGCMYTTLYLRCALSRLSVRIIRNGNKKKILQTAVTMQVINFVSPRVVILMLQKQNKHFRWLSRPRYIQSSRKLEAQAYTIGPHYNTDGFLSDGYVAYRCPNVISML